MESARLRIKFTPLLQNMRKNDSKCCLQIIPEVTDVQNLDKIEWTQNSNLMEYVIPMTYKIILKKRHKQLDNDELIINSNKTYHSCVDLLLPSSISSMDLGCGDIARMISDTLVFSKLADIDDLKNNIFSTKVTSDTQSVEPVIKSLNSRTPILRELDNDCQMADVSVSVMNIKHVCTFSYTIEEKDKNCQVPDNSSTCTDPENVSLLDKVTNTESTILIHNYLNFTTFPTVTKISTRTIKGLGKEESKRKLSVTPICSINTVDNVMNTVTAVTSNTVICRLYDSLTKNIKPATSDSFSNTSNDNSLSSSTANPPDLKSLKKMNPAICDVFPEDNKTPRRILPEVRISMFMRLMKNEIMPLQVMLNDILRKCSSLGIQWDSNAVGNHKSIVYKNVPELYSRVKQCREKSKSNRVVYSIVFDD